MVDETEDDLVIKLLRLIQEGNVDEAEDLILAQATLVEQLEVLDRLADQLGRKALKLRLQLALALGLRRALDVVRAPDLALARTLAEALAQALDIIQALDSASARSQAIAIALAHDRELTRKLALSLANELALDVALDLDRALDISRGLDRSLTLPRDQISYIARLIVLSVSGITNTQDVGHLAERQRLQLANTLDEGLFLHAVYDEPVLAVICSTLSKTSGDSLRHITLESAHATTPDVLTHHIAPYLQAMQTVQRVHNEIHGHNSRFAAVPQPRLDALYGSGPKLELAGFADAIRAVYAILIHHRRTPETEIDAPRNDQQRLENETKALLQALAPPAATIDDYAVHLPALLTAARTLMESSLTLRIGHHDTPRPDTLPEFDEDE
ncbi:MAG: hypothetical protein KJ065_21410 [Anaerolineae bacterium]|nr:hypothetical protein [Anaerolineae bacterium]